MAPTITLHPPRVVITGAGLITALGAGWTTNAHGFRCGNSAFRPVTLFDVSRQRTRVAAEIPDIPVPQPSRLSANRIARMDRAGRLLWAALTEALAMARLNDPPASVAPHMPVILATTSAGMNSGQAFFTTATRNPTRKRGQATHVAEYFVCRQTRDLTEEFPQLGPCTVIANACASGANAIGHAWELIRSGRTLQAVAGGYDALSQLVFAGFDSLQALSPTVCRPFDRQRDGLGLGEGAAMLVLERLDTAQQRGATILAELSGYGCATDIHHLTQPHPDGVAAVASMTEACRTAGIHPREVGYINAHGTGTPLNDASEAAAIQTWAGYDTANIPVSSTKSSVGHLLGAAGAVEAVVSVMALREGWLPPTSTLREPDPACRFPLVVTPTPAPDLRVVLSNSFGFGGSNATLAFQKFHG